MSECKHILGSCINDSGNGQAVFNCLLCGVKLYAWYGPVSADGLDRDKLENEIFKRLHIGQPSDIPVVRKSLQMKTTPQLEDLLKRMKEAGR